ncbi:MAG: FKBP-type peptidyl-prolyl cis-trans isomerase, partial [Nonlabens sp.]|nr:FKBP-type peptidyl-prolyl cis-trans isomerase [Nonlabens sp.]
SFQPKSLTLTSGVQFYVRKSGTGEKPVLNAPIEVDYSGFFPDGRLFDSSNYDVSLKFDNHKPSRNQLSYKPLSLNYNTSMQLIPGFKEAILTMGYGDEFTVFIPSSQGYGSRGAGGSIPPNADLVFEIKILPKK